MIPGHKGIYNLFIIGSTNGSINNQKLIQVANL